MTDPGAGQQQGREVCGEFGQHTPDRLCRRCGHRSDPELERDPDGATKVGTPEGAGQQQGREACEGCGIRAPVPHSWWCSVEHTPVDSGDAVAMHLARIEAAPSSAHPARHSGRDEAREAVARWAWLRACKASPNRWVPYADGYEAADELLNLPELRRLLDGAR